MSAEVLTTIATGLALLGFAWRMHVSLDRKIDGLRNDVSNDLSGINGRLSAIEGKLELLVQGLDIEISGKGKA